MELRVLKYFLAVARHRNKELLIIPGANHTDLYDNMEKIPFDKITAFFQKYLK